MKASRSQACSIFGISRWNFDTLVKEGLPASKKIGGRGGDWVGDTIEMHNWLVGRACKAGDGGESPSERADGGLIDFDKERARLTKAQADKLARERRQDEREPGRSRPAAGPGRPPRRRRSAAAC